MENSKAGSKGEVVSTLTAAIVAAYVGNNVVSVRELPKLIADVHNALDVVGKSSPQPPIDDKPKPAVPVKKSVQDDQITCLECGQGFRSLKRHLSTHGLSTAEYRSKWGLSTDYPMVAPVYAKARSRLAKQMGFGRRAPLKKPARK